MCHGPSVSYVSVCPFTWQIVFASARPSPSEAELVPSFRKRSNISSGSIWIGAPVLRTTNLPALSVISIVPPFILYRIALVSRLLTSTSANAGCITGPVGSIAVFTVISRCSIRSSRSRSFRLMIGTRLIGSVPARNCRFSILVSNNMPGSAWRACWRLR